MAATWEYRETRATVVTGGEVDRTNLNMVLAAIDLDGWDLVSDGETAVALSVGLQNVQGDPWMFWRRPIGYAAG
jgi:hypothetical protein